MLFYARPLLVALVLLVLAIAKNAHASSDSVIDSSWHHQRPLFFVGSKLQTTGQCVAVGTAVVKFRCSQHQPTSLYENKIIDAVSRNVEDGAVEKESEYFITDAQFVRKSKNFASISCDLFMNDIPTLLISSFEVCCINVQLKLFPSTQMISLYMSGNEHRSGTCS